MDATYQLMYMRTYNKTNQTLIPMTKTNYIPMTKTNYNDN